MNAPSTLPALEINEPTPGMYHGISNADYHDLPGISKSGLDCVNQSPAHYYGRYLDPARPADDNTQTTAQQDGELAHCAILEPDEFNKRFVVGPNVSRATKSWKEFAESAAAAGKAAIKPAQYATAWSQAASVRKIHDVTSALANGKPEVSAFWIDPETQVLCKCRTDFVHDVGDAGVILVDVKTCGNASPKEFSRMIAKHRYHVQSAWYSDGYAVASGRQVLAFIFAAVEMAYPYAASAIMLDAESIDQGRNEYRRNLNTYAECLSLGVWSGYENTVQLVRLPEWAFDNEEELEISYVT